MKPILSLNVRNSDENKSSLKGKYFAKLKAPNKIVGMKLNSSTVTSLLITKSLSFLRQKLSSLKVLLVTISVKKPILSLNVRNRDENKSLLKGKYELVVTLSANPISLLQVANSGEIQVVTKSCIHISSLFSSSFSLPTKPNSFSLTLSLTQPTT